MAVKVKIKKKRAQPVGFRAADVAHPDERGARLTGLGIGAGVIVVVLGLLALTPLRLQLMAAWAVWTLVALVYYRISAVNQELRRLLGPAPRGGATAPADLAELADRQARQAGVLAQIAVSADVPELLTIKDTIAVPAALREGLNPAEIGALIGREIGHIKAGHVGLLNLCRRVNREERVLTRVLGLPLRALARGLANWRWYAEMTADRMALVLTRERGALSAALLKQATMAAEGISIADIDEYLSRHGGLAVQSAEVATHFKLGEVLRAREDLMYRLRAIAQYAESEEYKQACAKLDAGQRAPGKQG